LLSFTRSDLGKRWQRERNSTKKLTEQGFTEAVQGKILFFLTFWWNLPNTKVVGV